MRTTARNARCSVDKRGSQRTIMQVCATPKGQIAIPKRKPSGIPKSKSVRDQHVRFFCFLAFVPRSTHRLSPQFGLGIPRSHFIEFDEKRVHNLHKRVSNDLFRTIAVVKLLLPGIQPRTTIRRFLSTSYFLIGFCDFLLVLWCRIASAIGPSRDGPENIPLFNMF